MVVLMVMTLLPVMAPEASAYTQGWDGMGTRRLYGNRDFSWPVNGYHNIQSCFYDHRNHLAIDAYAPEGTNILAAYTGEVVYIDPNYVYGSDCGRCVILCHENYHRCADGSVVTLYTEYNDMDAIYVEYNQTMSKGQAFGTVGHTGYS